MGALNINHTKTIGGFSISEGDRWEVYITEEASRTGKIPLEAALLTLFSEISETETVVVAWRTSQNQIALDYDPIEGLLRLPAPAPTPVLEKTKPLSKSKSSQTTLAAKPDLESGLAVLECRSVTPLTFQLEPIVNLLEKGSAKSEKEKEKIRQTSLTTETGVAIAFSPTDEDNLSLALQRYVPLEHFRLSLKAAQLGLKAGFDTVRCLPLLHDVELLDHQTRTVRVVLNRLHGRALLCDEVGLGKTVEAGMILLELVMRGLVRRTLILTPPSLVEQWQSELSRKFGLDSITYDDPGFRQEGLAAWDQYERIVASYHTAKREPHRAAILEQEWDIVIVDEAHHFRNRTTALWQMAAKLKRQYMLLLTATPVQNNLEDLFNLVGLIQPELLSTARAFQNQFVDRRDKLSPRNVDQLHGLLTEVMIRNRRATVGRALPHRFVRTESVTLSDTERTLYSAVSDLVRTRLRSTTTPKRAHLNKMTLLTLQKALGSSSPAAAPMLERLAGDTQFSAEEQGQWKALATLASQLEQHTKVERLLEIVRDLPDKVVIFTQFRDTQMLLQQSLSAAGESVVVFHGSLSRLQKEEAIRQFRGETRILISTDAGSEGRNLQFCNVICNFDLPWNPMKIEQRIGRLSRIGQTRDVHVINLVAGETLESALLYLLDAKIAMFELVIGEIDMILGNVDEEKEFEELVTEIWLETRDNTAFHKALDQLGDRLVVAREAYLRQRAQEEKLFGDRFAAEA